MIAAVPAMAQSTYPVQRKGFTILINAGAGVQDEAGRMVLGPELESSDVGLLVNLGIGDFLKHDLAVMLRFSATRTKKAYLGNSHQASGVAGITLQYWFKGQHYFEAGPGVGFVAREVGETHAGIGAIVGLGTSIYNRGRHNVHVGLEYAPAVILGNAVHNFGLNVGYQLF